MIHSNKQVALVTGSARRIGAAIVTLLHQAGYRVIIHCHQSQTMANTLAEEFNHQRTDSALVLNADLRHKSATQQLVTQTLAWAGQLDLVVNNASLFAPSPIQESMDDLWDELFIINVKAPYWLSQAAYIALSKTKGSIINITDIHATTPLKNYAVYCQTKAALALQTKALAREFAPKVRVNAIAPGAITWPEHQNALEEDIKQKIISQTPLQRHGDPIFIAQAVLSLAENSFITGQSLAIDGGRII